MKVIDQSPIRAEIKPFDKFKAYFNGVSKYGWGWTADTKAEETIIASLKQFIDNTYTVIRNVMLEGIDIPIPLVLVGPSGIYVLLSSGEAGVFRAKGEVWMAMNRKSRKYAPVRKNLIARAQLMARVVDAYLTHHQRPHPPVQTALLFGNAGAHVDSVRSAVRVVLKDGMERFANSVVQGQAVYKTRDETQEIVDTLTGNLPLPEEALVEPAARTPRKLTPVDKLDKAAQKMGWRKRQWIILAALAFFEAVLLIFIFVFIVSAFG
jgi:hypothetical protein